MPGQKTRHQKLNSYLVMNSLANCVLEALKDIQVIFCVILVFRMNECINNLTLNKMTTKLLIFNNKVLKYHIVLRYRLNLLTIISK